MAALIGDKSQRMGTHYIRHVESEVSVKRAFERRNMNRSVEKLSNAKDQVSNICRFGAKRLWKSTMRTWRNW